ncbi:hypothetical protein GCM10010512_19090 [Streptomyces thermoviolaceus subsp. thermoviolaceus]|nr:hypothetical protein GCM10010499_24670 [Streptomyces thermoviolaceus subsp. apingens]GHA87850.1 hypothetical protein GCM10010512_19090 [Streptomyces thermoviolaceus subsp. thermoviolaceus]
MLTYVTDPRITDGGTMPGTVLLLAASPVGKARLVDAASVLPVLAAVEPSVLAGTGSASVVELADPLDPQAVLTRLRAAAASPGPLTVYVTGQLTLDRRQHQLHLCLARTTPATVRYTALPWHWLRDEMRLRPDGTTTVVADLYADQESWQELGRRPLDAGRTVAVYGRIAPPPTRRTVAAPGYMKAVATILRSGHRPPLDQLHEQALARLAAEHRADGAWQGPGIVLASSRPPADDPHAAIASWVAAGRHGDADAFAARWEQAAVREHGAASEEALHWSEVRADLAMMAGDAARSCRAWLSVAATRLAMGQSADSAQVEAAVDRAHHQWGRVTDPGEAQELGTILAELRARVPGRRQGALDHVRRQLRQLQTQT